MKVAIVGGGFAGVAAAFAARRAGAEVTLLQRGPGASALYSGAVDGELNGPADALGELSAALGLRLGASAMVATREGVVRAASGSDAALLDLTPLAGKSIAVVDVARDDWDAPLLARAFAESDWARTTRTRFQLVPVDLLETGYQRRVAAFDFATVLERTDGPARLRELLKAQAGPDGWLFGPWLGIARPLAAELTHAVGAAVGEVTSPLGGAAGARFELRRDELLLRLGVEVVRQSVGEVRLSTDGVLLRLANGRECAARALVVACGGVVSGAISLSGSLSGAVSAGFELGVAGLPALELRGQQASPVSSLFGIDFAARGRGVLERVGLPVSPEGRVRGLERVFAAGDVLGAAPPSVGHALSTGLRAGFLAASCAKSEG